LGAPKGRALAGVNKELMQKSFIQKSKPLIRLHKSESVARWEPRHMYEGSAI
jgi:hypothetical protein